MGIRIVRLIPGLFLALALVFFWVGIRPGTNSIARRVRMRIALIFLFVGIGLFFLQAKSLAP
ncbi:MAG: hypothetical protein OHK0028_03400 [Deltaproteobacteria bacterium]